MTLAMLLLSSSTRKDCLGHLSPLFIAVVDVRKDSALGWRISPENDACSVAPLIKHSK